MSVQEFSLPSEKESHRVVEAEIRLPKWEDVSLSKVDLTPARHVAEEVLLVSLGLGVLAVRGVASAVKAAYKAGSEAVENPGPVTKTVLDWVRGTAKPQPAGGAVRMSVPVLPIDNYDGRTETEVLERLGGLSVEQLRVVREYEVAHARRTAILEAIARKLETA